MCTAKPWREGYQTPSFEVWKLRKAVFSLLCRMEARLPPEGSGENEDRALLPRLRRGRRGTRSRPFAWASQRKKITQPCSAACPEHHATLRAGFLPTAEGNAQRRLGGAGPVPNPAGSAGLCRANRKIPIGSVPSSLGWSSLPSNPQQRNDGHRRT